MIELLRQVKHLPLAVALDPEREATWAGENLFFVTGRPKCGNTWIGRMLGSHPKVFCDNDENACFHYEYRYSWNESSPEEMTDTVLDFFHSRTLSNTKRGLLSAIRSHCYKRSAALFGDKTPSIDIAKAREAFPQARFIISVRDPRDMVVSFAFHQARVNGGDWRLSFEDEAQTEIRTDFIKQIVDKFRRYRDFETYYAFAEREPDRCIIVRYEDLLADTAGEMARAFGFLGVKVAAKELDAIVARNSFKAITKNRDAGQADASSFFRKGIAGDWRNCLADEQVALVERGFAKELQLGGYA